MIEFQTGFFFAAAFLLLLLPLRWILAAVIAGFIHEFCHIAAILLLNGKIRRITVGAGGCVIDTQPLTYRQQFVSILAGPLGGISLLLFRRLLPEAALCGLIHSLYNLIPIMPLDGGRLLKLLLEVLVPDKAEKVLDITRWGIILLITAGCLWAMAPLDGGIGWMLLVMVWLVRLIPRKIPCKPSKIKVQ